MAIDVINAGHDSLLELQLRCDADVTQDRTRELGEKSLDEVEPGPMLGREGEFEAAQWSCVEPGSGFFRDVSGMIVEDQLDRGAGRIGGIEQLEEFDELSTAMAVSDQGMDLATEQIDAGQQAERAMTFVLMITREGRVDAGFRRQIWRRRRERLDSGLFIIGDNRHRLGWFLRFGCGFFQDLDLAINAQNLGHL